MTGEQRLKIVQDRLIRAGVEDVKIFLAPGSAEHVGLDRLANDLAKLLEAYVDGRCTVIMTFAK